MKKRPRRSNSSAFAGSPWIYSRRLRGESDRLNFGLSWPFVARLLDADDIPSASYGHLGIS